MQVAKIKSSKQCVLFCAMIFSCVISAAAAMPKWVEAPYKVYSKDKYFAAVGRGTSAKNAELDAVQNLAAIFGRDIKSKSSSSSKMKQAQQNGVVSTGQTSEFSQNITQKVSVEDLIGVDLKESYVDGKTYYALAVMDKVETTTAIVSTVQANNKKIAELLDYDSDDQYSFNTYSRLSFANEIAVLDEKFIEKLDVINSNSAASLKKQIIPSKDVKLKMIEVAKQIPIYISVENDSNNQVKQALSQMVTASGMQTSDQKGERYSITGNVIIDSPEKSKDGKSVQCYYTFEGVLSDSLFDENLLPINIQGREGSTNESAAIRRAYQAITSKIKTTTTSSFLNFLNSL